MTTTVADLVSAVDAIAPLAHAEEWDNVGLLLGSAADAVRGPVLLTIDLTGAVLDEAARVGATTIIAYHPPIFTAIKRLTAADPRQAIVLRAARSGVSLISPHTALDAAPGGLADWLADACFEASSPRSADRRALKPLGRHEATQQVKIVTYVPEGDVEAVRSALASAGAGIIGHYEVCSFSVAGSGTFLARLGARPAVGVVGQLESVREQRLEMVCSRRAVPLALEHLRQFHPYEEPAIDIYPLEPKPRRDTGVGRRLMLDRPVTLAALAQRVKQRLGLSHVDVAAAAGATMETPIQTIGVCPGSGAELADAAIGEGCQAYLTGEMKHHEVMAATTRGLSLILGGHTATERGYLPTLGRRLEEYVPGLKTRVSEADREVVVTV